MTAIAVATATVLAAPAANAAPTTELSVVPAAVPMAAAEHLASFDSQLLSLMNSARAGAGAPALSSAGGLAQLAIWWSTQMSDGATGGTLAHNPNAWTMVTSYGASSRTTWAENVAKFPAGSSAQAVFTAYMNSPGHRANIMNKAYRYVGVGSVSNGTTAYNTMEFTDKVDGAPAPAPAKPAPAPAKPAPAPAKPAPAPAKPAPAKPAPAPAKPAPAPAKPAPAPAKPAAAKPAPKPAAAPAKPAAAKPAPKPAAAARPATSPQQQVASAPATHTAVPGSLLASFGALPVAGITFAIDNNNCADNSPTATTPTTTTGADGRAHLTAGPGSYCAVAVAAPDGVVVPGPVGFTVTAGPHFTVTVGDLQTVAVWWPARGSWLMLPV